MIDVYRNKAKRATTLYQVEYALKDIRETLKLHSDWMMHHLGDTGGTTMVPPYVTQLLTERDAYLERWDELKKKERKNGN